MTLVKAKMSFYHDKVGTRALDEMFEVTSEQLASDLEQAGYVQRVEGEALTAHQENQNLQQQMGEISALANEAVSLATHEQNQQTLAHQKTFEQTRQQVMNHSAGVQNQSQAIHQAQMQADKAETAKKASK